MKNSDVYQIRLTPNFDLTYHKLLKTHYKRDSKAKKKFEDLIVNTTSELEKSPYSHPLSKRENFPHDTAVSSIQLRKVRWYSLPGLYGIASKGRLIYLVIEPLKRVDYLWIYTHQEYQKRPPDPDLKRLIKDICKQEDLS